MKVIYVDDEKLILKKFLSACQNIDKISSIETFQDGYEAIEFVKEHEVNCAFLDIEMPQINGLELAKELKKMKSDIVIIFITAHDEYMVNAFRDIGVDYYLLKPYNEKDIKDVVERAYLLSRRQKKSIYIETFGNFNVYKDGNLVNFSSKIAKEILALLVDCKGTAITNKDAFYCMFDDLPCTHENMARIRKGMGRLKNILEKEGMSQLLITNRTEYCIDTSLFDCDYYQLLDGDANAYKKYQGEYMLQYSWAEETNGYLSQLKLNKQ